MTKILLEMFNPGYVHADSTSGGVGLVDLMFDRINRGTSDETQPLWIPIPDLNLGRAEAYHVCSVKNCLNLIQKEGQFQLAASTHPNVNRMKSGIGGINSGGGVLVRVAGHANAVFPADMSTVVSEGRRWISLRLLQLRAPQASLSNLAERIWQLRGSFLQEMRDAIGGDSPWETYKVITFGEASSYSLASSWTYFIGSFLGNNWPLPVADDFFARYLRELSELVNSARANLIPALNRGSGEKAKRFVHDELIMSRGWSVTEVIPTTPAAAKELAAAGVKTTKRSFSDLKTEFSWPK